MQETLDLDAIMREIKAKAKQRARNLEDIPEFQGLSLEMETESEFSYEKLQDEIRAMLSGYEIAMETPFSGSGAKSLMKRVIAKMNRFWAAPMAAQQTGFNDAAVRVCSQLERYVIMQQEIIKSLEHRIQSLEKNDREEAVKDV